MTDYQRWFKEVDEEVERVINYDRARQAQLRELAVAKARDVFHPVLQDIATSFSRTIDPTGNHQYAYVEPVHSQSIGENNTAVSLRMTMGRSFETLQALTFDFNVASHYARDKVTVSASANANGYGRLDLTELLESLTPEEDLAEVVFAALKAYKLNRAGIPSGENADEVSTKIVF